MEVLVSLTGPGYLGVNACQVCKRRKASNQGATASPCVPVSLVLYLFGLCHRLMGSPVSGQLSPLARSGLALIAQCNICLFSTLSVLSMFSSFAQTSLGGSPI